jgi:hypothetical protein
MKPPGFALCGMGPWGVKYLAVTEELGVRAELLAGGGPATWNAFMNELRERHLGAPVSRKKRGGLSVTEQLEAAYEAALAQRGR